MSTVEDFSKPDKMMDDYGRRREDWVIEESPLLLGIIAPDLRLKNLNRTWEKVLGYPRAMLLGKPLTRLIDQGEQAHALMLVNTRLVVEAKPIEFSLRCNDGSYRCFEWERRPARGEEGMFITGRDITERKKMETTSNLQKYLQSKKTGRSA
jgi:PAS domain S-box-containing protein